MKPVLVLAAALLAAPVAAHAAETSFLKEFQAICLANLENPLAGRETALARGFKPLADPEGLGLIDGKELYVAVTRSVDSTVDISPPFNLKMCIVGTGAVADDQLQAIADWAGTPPLQEDEAVRYSFRLVDGRHVPVAADEAAQVAALKLGPIYEIEITPKEGFTSVLLGKMTKRP